MTDELKSRTRLKKEAHSLQAIGERLAKLPLSQLETMHLPEELLEAIRFLKTMNKHGALRRQMQYIGSLMRAIDIAPIEKALEVIEQGDYRKARTFHRIENMRDALLDGDDDRIYEILRDCPGADRQRLSHLVRSARKERLKKKTKKSARNLFAYLKQIYSETDSGETGS